MTEEEIRNIPIVPIKTTYITRIKANNKGERDILITALVNSGYTVRLVDVKTDGKREKVVEYWENEK